MTDAVMCQPRFWSTLERNQLLDIKDCTKLHYLIERVAALKIKIYSASQVSTECAFGKNEPHCLIVSCQPCLCQPMTAW